MAHRGPDLERREHTRSAIVSHFVLSLWGGYISVGIGWAAGRRPRVLRPVGGRRNLLWPARLVAGGVGLGPFFRLAVLCPARHSPGLERACFRRGGGADHGPQQPGPGRPDVWDAGTVGRPLEPLVAGRPAGDDPWRSGPGPLYLAGLAAPPPRRRAAQPPRGLA